MKLAIAQTKPVPGHLEQNIAAHIRLIESAAATGATMVVFPELSLTSYEPDKAARNSLHPEAPQLHIFQTLSNRRKLTLCIGAPTRRGDDLQISLMIFRPHQPPALYSKQYLHPDEEPYFVAADTAPVELPAALAICYEIMIPQHASAAVSAGATHYIASVAKHAGGVKQAYERLREVARTHQIPVMMANSIGRQDGAQCTGGSAVWSREGRLLSQLNAVNEGVICFDTETQECSRIQYSARQQSGAGFSDATHRKDAFSLVEELNQAQVEQLHELITHQWWGGQRTLQQVQRCLQHTSLLLALIDLETGDLAGFCRVLTDFTFRATVYDVMVAQHYQGIGLGRRLMDALCNHPRIKPVHLVYLCCEPPLESFYRQWDFETYQGRAGWMMRQQHAE